MRDGGDFERITKKEGLILTREIDRLEGLLSGIRNLIRPPDMLFVVDVSREATAIHEANLLNIPVVAMVDTNCDPSNVDYIIPSNDDAIRAIKLVVGIIADAAIEGLGLRKEETVEEEERIIARAPEEEAELSDEELLGEATLAKLVAHPKDVSSEEMDELEEEGEEIEPEEEEAEEEEAAAMVEEDEDEENAAMVEEDGDEENAEMIEEDEDEEAEGVEEAEAEGEISDETDESDETEEES
jgi:small subunit ribosomal protein S2